MSIQLAPGKPGNYTWIEHVRLSKKPKKKKRKEKKWNQKRMVKNEINYHRIRTGNLEINTLCR